MVQDGKTGRSVRRQMSAEVLRLRLASTRNTHTLHDKCITVTVLFEKIAIIEDIEINEKHG